MHGRDVREPDKRLWRLRDRVEVEERGMSLTRCPFDLHQAIPRSTSARVSAGLPGVTTPIVEPGGAERAISWATL